MAATDTAVGGETLICIALPLPLDITGRVTEAIGTIYPNATIRTDTGDGRHLVVAVPDDDRWAPEDFDDSDAESGETAKPSRPPMIDAESVEAILVSLEDGSFGISASHYLGALFAGMARQALADADAPNYVVITIGDPANPTDVYDLIVCRPGRPSPNDLRRQAEERADRYAAALRDAGIDPESLWGRR
jgi:hypothetical protein